MPTLDNKIISNIISLGGIYQQMAPEITFPTLFPLPSLISPKPFNPLRSGEKKEGGEEKGGYCSSCIFGLGKAMHQENRRDCIEG